MKKKHLILLYSSITLNILCIVSIAILMLWYTPTLQAKATNTIQSQGKLIYNDDLTGDKIIIDTSDHELFQEGIAELQRNIYSIKNSEHSIRCDANPYHYMEMFTYDGNKCVLRSVLANQCYVDLVMDTSGIQYTYVVNGITLKHGYLAQF